MGPYPRGIVVSPDSRTAYVAIMGADDIARVDLTTFGVSWISGIGQGPRHLVISPDGAALYATLNAEGKVVKIDPVSGAVLNKVATGTQPRSMAISTDGQSLYVVNYESSDVTKLAAERPPHPADRADGLPPDRHHLRPHDGRGLGGQLRRLASRSSPRPDVALLLGVLVAITYGSGDFLGGLAMRRAPVGATVLWTQAIGLVALAGRGDRRRRQRHTR